MEMNPKVEAYLRKDLAEKKAWAVEKEKEVGREWKQASEVSRKMLHKYLDKSVDEMLPESYAYFKMRAHAKGDNWGGFIAPDAKAKWERITGEQII